MRERTELLIRGMTENRTKRHRWLAMVTALAFLTGGNVFWSLREIGTAVTEETLCTREAHQHSEECYDENGNLICGKEEHVHTAGCFSDENADVETAEIWEATLPERAGLSHQEQVALIAESQLGYAESVNNFILGEDGVQHGYTRYGAWYGNPYGEWNTMFTYFCLYYAGVSAEEIPCIGNARTWQVKLTENELIRPPDMEPERGEIVLLDLDADGEADLTGIVTDTAEMLHFVEGNLGHAVAEGELAPDAEQILGYVAIPEPDTPDAETPEASPPDESPPEDADESSPDAEPAPTEEQPAASESEQPLVTYKAESASGIQVSAVAAEGVFPADTVMTAMDVPHEEALQAAAEGLSAGAETLDAVAVDISFYAADGTELEPDGGVDVEITLPEAQQLAGENYTLLHVADDGAVETVEAEIAGDVVTFTADGFSIYILTSSGEYCDVTKPFTVDGHTFTKNDSSNPYILHVGESFKLYSEASNSMRQDAGRQYYASTSPDPKGVLTRSFTYATEPPYKVVEKNGKMIRECEATYKAVSSGTVTVAVEYETNKFEYFYVEVLEKPQEYYVWRNQEPISASDLKFGDQTFPNSETNPYIVYVGETFDIFVSEKSFILPNNEENGLKKLEALENPDTHNSETITCDNQSVAGTRRSFRALNPGDVYCQANDGQKFYIKVVDPGGNLDDSKPTLYVKSSFEDKKINEVKEWLKGYGLPNQQGYVPNAVGREAGKQYNNNNQYHEYGRPYTIRVGDTFEIYANEEGAFSYTNYDLAYGDNTFWNFDLKLSDSDKIKPIPVDGYEAPKTAVGFIGDKPGETSVTFINQHGKTQTMWVRVLSETEIYNHADMEIADGGKYTVASTSYENGRKITTLKVYDAFVSRVNSAELLDSSGEPMALRVNANQYDYCFTSDGDIKYVKINDDVQGNQVGDYLQIGSQGSTQYELSSAYGRTKEFNTNLVKTVKFDVNVTLRPEKQCTITDGTIGAWEDINGEANSEVSHVLWIFDQQGIVDAINKCPLTNGYDFTIRANAALVDLKAVKKLNGSNLTANQFAFQLYDANAQPVGSPVTNDADGNIVFLNQKFEEAGMYSYTIKEVIPTDGTQDQQLIYATDQEIIIDVTEVDVPDGSGNTIKALKAEMRNPPPTLTNYVTFRLPDTGGVGNLPWYLGGTVILAAASLLLIKKRREGS